MTTVREPRLEPVAILDLPLACVILCIEQIGFVFIIAQSWFSIDLIFQCDFVSFCKKDHLYVYNYAMQSY